jgi:hypothetical protein
MTLVLRRLMSIWIELKRPLEHLGSSYRAKARLHVVETRHNSEKFFKDIFSNVPTSYALSCLEIPGRRTCRTQQGSGDPTDTIDSRNGLSS